MLRHLQQIAARLPFLENAANLLIGNGAPIFMFHRVLPSQDECYDPEMATSTDLFEKFLQWARDHYEVVPLPELLRADTKSHHKQRRLCAFTFDDGWRDTYQHAFPLLRRYQMPATVFLIAGFIGTERHLWQERLWTLLRQSNGLLESEALLYGFCRSFPWCQRLNSAEFNFSGLRRLLLVRSSVEAEEFVARLEELAGGPKTFSERAFLGWDEVLQMQKAGIAFGSHTVNHTLLTRAAPETARQEIERSLHQLRERLGETPMGFSYPWGSTDSRLTSCVQGTGYAFAVTTRAGLLQSDTNAWLLPRVAISSPILEQWLVRLQPSGTALYLAANSLQGKMHGRTSCQECVAF